jgi:hypothetical protein
MTDVLHYRGNVVDDLIAQGQARDLFGPDICGSGGMSNEDVRAACRVGAYDALRAAAGEVLRRGAFYEVTAAHYDPDTDITTASFVPYIDPRQRVRYHGGAGNPDDQLTGPTLHEHDTIRGH